MIIRSMVIGGSYGSVSPPGAGPPGSSPLSPLSPLPDRAAHPGGHSGRVPWVREPGGRGKMRIFNGF